MTRGALAMFAAGLGATTVVAAEPTIRLTGGGDQVVEQRAGLTGRAFVPADPANYNALGTQDRFRAVMLDYMTCVSNARRSAFDRLLAMPIGGAAATQAAQAVVDQRCLLRGNLDVRPGDLQRAAFVARYQSAYRLGAPRLQPQAIDFMAVAAGLTGDGLQNFVSSRRFGDCVVRADPVLAHNFVVAAPGRPSEDTALQALLPNLGPCLGKGAKVELTKDYLKGLLAEVTVRSAA